MGRYMSPLVKQDLAKLSEDGDSRRLAMHSLKSFVGQLDAGSMPRFLAQVSECRDEGTTRCYAISLFEDVARIHGKFIIQHVPRMLSTIIRFLSASGSSLQLHQACAHVVVAIVQHTIEPLSPPGQQAHALVNDVCEPLLEVLAGTFEPLAAGAAICLQALVESERWKFASMDLIQETCLRCTIALGDKATRTVGHMQLARALALKNGDVLGAYGLALLRSACQALRASIGNGTWHHRVSAARLIQAVLAKLDTMTLAAEVSYTMQVLEGFRHDRIPHVRSAVADTLQTAKFLLSEENSRRSTRGEQLIPGPSAFMDLDYYKKSTNMWNSTTGSLSTCSKAEAAMLQAQKESHLSQESHVVSFSPSPSSSTPSESSAKQRRNSRFSPRYEPSKWTSSVSLAEEGNLDKSGVLVNSSEIEEKFIRTSQKMQRKEQRNKRDLFSKLKKHALLPDTSCANIPANMRPSMETEREESAATLQKTNGLLSLFDNTILPIFDRDASEYDEDGGDNGNERAEFTSIEDFDDRRSLDSMIQKERIGEKCSSKSINLDQTTICSMSLMEKESFFLTDPTNRDLFDDCLRDKSTTLANDFCIAKNQNRDQHALPSKFDSTFVAISKEAQHVESPPSVHDHIIPSDEVRHDVEEIDLQTSSEHGWSVHDNPIASDATFEHEEPESSVVNLHCNSKGSKAGAEIDYSSSGSNLQEQEHGSNEIVESSRINLHATFDQKDIDNRITEFSSLTKRFSKRSSHMDRWNTFNGVTIHKKGKGTRWKYKYCSYSAFFFLQKKNWTRMWSCMEILVGGTICAILALPVAMAVSTVWDPLYLDYNFLAPT